MAKQLGFIIDTRRCVQCHACEVACKTTNGVEPGVSWRKVLNVWQGQFPNVTNRSISLSCLHCAYPACRDVCFKGAIKKRAEDGIVVVDAEVCNGCGKCADACPYGVPRFGRDGKLQLCNLCLDSLQEGKEPACVATCPGEALAFGDMEALAKLAAAKGGERLPGATGPSLFVTSADESLSPEAYVAEFFRR